MSTNKNEEKEIFLSFWNMKFYKISFGIFTKYTFWATIFWAVYIQIFTFSSLSSALTCWVSFVYAFTLFSMEFKINTINSFLFYFFSCLLISNIFSYIISFFL